MNNSSVATLDIDTAQKEFWDLVVIGAGPAGSTIARNASLAGARTLIIDKSQFPRYKVCGCCLNKLALDLLNEAGLQEELDKLHPVYLNKLLLANKGSLAQIAIGPAAAVSRQAFDWLLLKQAMQAGASLLSSTHAFVLEVKGLYRQILLQSKQQSVKIQAKVVVSADGLSGRSLHWLSGFERTELPASRIGAGTVLSEVPDYYHSGIIYMALTQNGYVGQVKLEDGQLDVAAAFDREFLHNCDTPVAAAKMIIKEAGLPVAREFDNSIWKGTSALTSHRVKLSDERLFLIGDAAGYAEPFTGEGIVWALKSAILILPLVLQGINGWSSELSNSWSLLYGKYVGQKQNKSLQIALLLRKELLMQAVTTVLTSAPWLAVPLVRKINAF